MNVRAKFMLQEERIYGHDSHYRQHTFVFRTQYDSSIREDRRFATATPSGELTIAMDNPAVVEAWSGKMGSLFYLDFTPVSDDPPA